MQILIILFAVLFQINPQSDKVISYHTKKGKTVQSYKRTAPNHTTKDNYSHTGNTNPNTGKKGYEKGKKEQYFSK